MVRTLVAAALAVALVPSLASADGRCKPYFYDTDVAGHTVPMVGVVC